MRLRSSRPWPVDDVCPGAAIPESKPIFEHDGAHNLMHHSFNEVRCKSSSRGIARGSLAQKACGRTRQEFLSIDDSLKNIHADTELIQDISRNHGSAELGFDGPGNCSFATGAK